MSALNMRDASNKFTRHAFGTGGYLFRRAARHYPTAVLPASGAHIDDIVGVSYNIEVMLDHHHRGAVDDESLEYADERFDI